ncbi:unnamed protein product [Oncorhynchus mykiss]|uniref:Rab-GAP TBC domain-containing protein n=2 Tax=Oncorhynchus mykiss TaxID=8022 RepID=A0A061A7N2_ONCMY|nr:unnamed protein product [Oncorhynchus mykiss]
MVQHNVMWTLVVSQWFICLYIDVLPVETVLRIWDCLFYEGSKILFRVALTLIRHHQAEILQARSMVEVCECFKLITQGVFTYDCHTFMQEGLFLFFLIDRKASFLFLILTGNPPFSSS